MALFGVDISEHNGFIDFDQLKNNVDFVIIRSSWGSLRKIYEPGETHLNVNGLAFRTDFTIIAMLEIWEKHKLRSMPF